MKNHPELERFAGVVHTAAASAYGVLVLCHLLGVPWNDRRGNRFEGVVHRIGLGWAISAITFHAFAAVMHRRDAKG